QELVSRRNYSRSRSTPAAGLYRPSTPQRRGSQWVPTATPWLHWAKKGKTKPARSPPKENVFPPPGLPPKKHYRCNRTNQSASAFVPPPYRQTREPAVHRIL